MGQVRAWSPRLRWSDAEIDLLKTCYESATCAELNALFPNRARRNVHCKAHTLGLSRPVRVKLTKEEILRKKREYAARARARNPEASRTKQQLWHAANRDRSRAKMRAYAKRRFFWTKAMKLRGEERATARDIARLWKYQKGFCALTGRRLDRDAQLDHKTPKAKGGGDEVGNLQWLCPEVNLAKRDLTDAEFANLCAEVVSASGLV